MSNTIYIDSEQAEEIMYGKDSYIEKRRGDEHRWYTDVWYVFENEDHKYYEFCHMSPATEMQEGQDEWDDPDEIPCYEVKSKQVLATIWERVE